MTASFQDTTAGPAAHPAPAAAVADRPRDDLAAVLGKLEPTVRALVLGPCREALDLLHAHLPAQETVWALLPCRANITASATTCLTALTNRRLILITPLPQARSWQLTTLESVQFVPGSAFHVEADGAKYMMGADPQTSRAGTEFEVLVRRAGAEAVLRLG